MLGIIGRESIIDVRMGEEEEKMEFDEKKRENTTIKKEKKLKEYEEKVERVEKEELAMGLRSREGASNPRRKRKHSSDYEQESNSFDENRMGISTRQKRHRDPAPA